MRRTTNSVKQGVMSHADGHKNVRMSSECSSTCSMVEHSREAFSFHPTARFPLMVPINSSVKEGLKLRLSRPDMAPANEVNEQTSLLTALESQ